MSLTSLYENSKDMDDIIVYILDSGISGVNRDKILSVAAIYKRTMPEFIKAKNVAMEQETMDERVPA